MIVENIQKLLGVYTTTSALEKIANLLNLQAAQPPLHPTGGEAVAENKVEKPASG